MSGVPYVGGGYYDISSYEKVRITFYVEKQSNYPMMLHFVSDKDANNKDGYFGFYFTVNETGWKTLEFDLSKTSTSNYSPNWDKIRSVGVTVAGWSFGDGKGKAIDGTVMYIASIELIDNDAKVTKNAVASYLVDDSVCKDAHELDSGTKVAPAVHVDGYTIYSCKNCAHVEVVQDKGTALTHTEDMYTRDEANYRLPTCEAIGENYYSLHCDICGTVKYREWIPMLGHDWKVVEGAEVEEGYELVECTHEGCTRGQVLRKIANNLSAFEEN